MCSTAGVVTKPPGFGQVFIPVARPELRHGSRAAGELPFRFRRKLVTGSIKRHDVLSLALVEGLVSFQKAQLRAAFGSVVPADVVHRKSSGVHPGDSLVTVQLIVMRGIFSHHFFVLGLRDFVSTKVDWLR